MNAAQCRMARSALQLAVRELADLANVSPTTIVRLEAGEELKPRTVAAIRTALENAGVVFGDQDGMVCVKLVTAEPATSIQVEVLNAANDE